MNLKRIERDHLRRIKARIIKLPSYFGDGDDWEAQIAQAQVSSGGWYNGKDWLTAEEIDRAEKRWASRAYRDEAKRPDDWIPYQCGGCRFFAAFGSDYGLCVNVASPLDGMVTFEHGGCLEHSGIEKL